MTPEGGSELSLAERVLEGDRRALARLISRIEDREPGVDEEVAILYPEAGDARVVGLTGPPGVGKSTLADRLIERFRDRDLTVGVLAVDPMSPFTGGAFLGDRVRMEEWTTDEGVFIRSMSSRGQLGGLAQAARNAVRALSAFGSDVVIVETVGIGQAEVDIVKVADQVAVITTPGLGDAIQHIKAGMMEIGDVFVVNKADQGRAGAVVADIRSMLDLGPEPEWPPKVVAVSARTGEGVDELASILEEHWAWLSEDGRLEDQRADQLRRELVDLVRDLAVRDVLGGDGIESRLDAVVEDLEAGDTDPFAAARRLYERRVEEE